MGVILVTGFYLLSPDFISILVFSQDIVMLQLDSVGFLHLRTRFKWVLFQGRRDVIYFRHMSKFELASGDRVLQSMVSDCCGDLQLTLNMVE